MTEAVPTIADMAPEWVTNCLRANGYDVTVTDVESGTNWHRSGWRDHCA